MSGVYRSRDSKLVNSLVNYVLDIKPYHTKLREFLSELYFSDDITVSFIGEYCQKDIYLQNVWTKDDIGSRFLQSVSEGTDADRRMYLPATIFPRFSLNTFLNYGQTPPGDDPATVDLEDLDVDGIPDSEMPPTINTGQSHLIGDSTLAGKYRVPFHHGSYVTVDGVPQTFGFHYYVDSSRGFIQFTPGNEPVDGARIDVNYWNSDRLFISVNDPFTFTGGGYDVPIFDGMGFDVPDAAADYYVLTVNSLAELGYSVSFFNAAPGTQKPEIADVFIYPSQNVDGYSWKFTAVGFQRLAVQQQTPFLGPIEYAVMNERFDNGLIAFTLKNTWLNYYFVQDENSYICYDLNVFDNDVYHQPLDPADFWPNVDIKTEHGVVVDPIPPRHAPVEIIGQVDLGDFTTDETPGNPGYDIDNVGYDVYFYDDAPSTFQQYPIYIDRPLGIVKQIPVDTLVGPATTYIFEFFDVPARGTYIEIQIEQARQYNPRVNVSFLEDFTFEQVASPDANLDTIQRILGHDLLGSGILGGGRDLFAGGPIEPDANLDTQQRILGHDLLGSGILGHGLDPQAVDLDTQQIILGHDLLGIGVLGHGQIPPFAVGPDLEADQLILGADILGSGILGGGQTDLPDYAPSETLGSEELGSEVLGS